MPLRPILVLLASCLTAPCPAAVIFTDVTASAGIAVLHAPKQLAVPGGLEYLLGGACVGDFNRDGWPDLFVQSGGTTADYLFINQGNGTFLNQTVAWGIPNPQAGMGCAVGDVDHDGWPDIYMASFGNGSNNQGELGKHRLYRNNGNGTFTNIAPSAGVNQNTTSVSACAGVAWGDYDLDGDLDLFIAAWSDTAAGNRLYRNNGNNTFTDRTGVAIAVPVLTWGFQPNFADMDGDGYPELLLAADFGTARFYRNNRDGSFTETTNQVGAGVVAYGMGQCVGDLDRDGYLDWYVTSIFGDPPLNPLAKNGNASYRGQTDGTFAEVSAANGTQDGGWGWGVVAGDFDQDGWLDLVEANGVSYGEWAGEPEYYYRNTGSGVFVRDATIGGQFLAGEARAVLTLDYDHDGDLDLLITYNQGPLKLYRNDSTAPGRWLEVRIDSPTGSKVPSFGYGTRLTAKAGGVAWTRVLDGGNSYLGSCELIAHLGLGGVTLLDELRCEWPRGNATILHNVPTNQRLTITAPAAADLDADATVGPADLAILLGGWGPADPLARYLDINDDGTVGSADLALLLGAWHP